MFVNQGQAATPTAIIETQEREHTPMDPEVSGQPDVRETQESQSESSKVPPIKLRQKWVPVGGDRREEWMVPSPWEVKDD